MARYIDSISGMDALNRIDDAMAVLEMLELSHVNEDTMKHALNAATTALYENLDTVRACIDKLQEIECEEMRIIAKAETEAK